MNFRMAPYNTTVEELEIRVERLEQDMFQAQVDIGEAEIDIDSLEFSLQETVETVSNSTTIQNYSTHFQPVDWGFLGWKGRS